MNKNLIITITAGDCSENHVGMKQYGTNNHNGFTIDELIKINEKLRSKNIKTEFIMLHDLLPDKVKYEHKQILKAGLLIIRNGVNELMNNVSNNKEANKKFGDLILQSLLDIEWDKKYYDIRRKRILNKRARWNVCFGNKSKSANLEEKEGTIIGYNEVPELKNLLSILPLYLGDKAKELEVEGNYYYDIKKCGIGFHGDTERSKVIGIRFGDTGKLAYRWYYQSKIISKKLEVNLNHGDIYIMSEKAVGNDWKKRSKFTLRHAAGCEKYLK